MSGTAQTYPLDTIVALVDVIGGLGYQASGVLISPDEVLTASHVVFHTGIGGASRIRVAPGFDGFAQHGIFDGQYYHANPTNTAGGLITRSETQNDFAVIHLSRPTGVGFMGLQADFSGGTVHATGYPGSPFGYQSDITETVAKDAKFSVLNGADTGAGTSGGPLWVSRDGQAFTVGLVSAGNGVSGFAFQLTRAALQQIQAWVYQDDYVNRLVDAPFYDAAYPDVAVAPLSASYHYDTFGWHEGRNPDAYFTTAGYLGANRDIKAAGVDPLIHYDTAGWREGRDPAANFDTTLYLLHNPDVARAGVDPLWHFLSNGKAEGRATFDAIGARVPITAGFDPEYYELANPDVAAAGVDPLAHFNTIGWREGRNPDAIFNTRAYLAAYQDVAQAGVNPLTHYEFSGWREGRDPAANFDTRAYLRNNGDVAAAGVNPLEHYLQSGVYEGRFTFADGRFA